MIERPSEVVETQKLKQSAKTQKIVLLNQAQSASSKEDQLAGLVTKKKLSLTDLLSKVNNLSLSTRLDGLDGLKELLTNHEKVLDDNLTLILSRLAPLLSEREQKLRRAGVVILEFMLTKVKPCTLESLYPLLCAHLCCGLSHIDSDIQFESIRILDTIIESQPPFVVQHMNQILPNCMNQIKKYIPHLNHPKKKLSMSVMVRFSSYKNSVTKIRGNV